MSNYPRHNTHVNNSSTLQQTSTKSYPVPTEKILRVNHVRFYICYVGYFCDSEIRTSCLSVPSLGFARPLKISSYRSSSLYFTITGFQAMFVKKSMFFTVAPSHQFSQTAKCQVILKSKQPSCKQTSQLLFYMSLCQTEVSQWSLGDHSDIPGRKLPTLTLPMTWQNLENPLQRD